MVVPIPLPIRLQPEQLADRLQVEAIGEVDENRSMKVSKKASIALLVRVMMVAPLVGSVTSGVRASESQW